MSLVTISSMFNKTITTWFLSSILFASCWNYSEFSYDPYQIWVSRKKWRLSGETITKYSTSIINCSYRLGRALIFNSFIKSSFCIWSSTSKKISFIILDRENHQRNNIIHQDRCNCTLLLFWICISDVASSHFFTYSENQRVDYIFKCSIAFLNSSIHIVIYF